MKSLGFILAIAAVLLPACSQEAPRQAQPKEQTITQKTEEQTGEALLRDAKDKLVEAKDKLAQEGKYGCCLKEPCNHCALNQGDCDCYKDLKKGEHVCIECYAGWQAGKGGIEGIKPSDVKTSITPAKD